MRTRLALFSRLLVSDMIVLKTARELGIMKEACVISALAFILVGSAVLLGVSTCELAQ